MRPGEISALNVDDILRKPTGVLLAIRRSKTDQEARGQLVGIARGQNALTDPIRALDDWLKIRPAEQGALFTRVLHRNHTTFERIGRARSAGRSRSEPPRPVSTAYLSPVTPCAPDTPPPRPSTERQSTASPPRPGIATSARCSTITSVQPRQ
jgi:hypothetical protein